MFWVFFFLFSFFLCNKPRKLEDEFKSAFQDSNTNRLHAGCLLKFMHFLNQTAETDWGRHLKVILFQMVPNVGWIAPPFDVFINQFEAPGSAPPLTPSPPLLPAHLFPCGHIWIREWWNQDEAKIIGASEQRRRMPSNSPKFPKRVFPRCRNLAGAMNITAWYADEEKKIWLSHINTFTQHQMNVWQVLKRICFSSSPFFFPSPLPFLNLSPFTARLLMPGNLEAQLAWMLCGLTERSNSKPVVCFAVVTHNNTVRECDLYTFTSTVIT